MWWIRRWFWRKSSDLYLGKVQSSDCCRCIVPVIRQSEDCNVLSSTLPNGQAGQ